MRLVPLSEEISEADKRRVLSLEPAATAYGERANGGDFIRELVALRALEVWVERVGGWREPTGGQQYTSSQVRRFLRDARVEFGELPGVQAVLDAHEADYPFEEP